MATLLCIETATTNCSVALSVDGKIISLQEDNNNKYSHAERLHNYIDAVIKKSGLKRAQLEAVAVSKGPGSYTGLRIGVSAAKGLCFALDIPLISTSTLETLAYQIKKGDGVIIPLLDARRMEVYSAVFSNKKEQIRRTKAEVIHKDSFSTFLNEGNVYFIGDGVEKFKAICKHKNAIFIENKLPSANEMGLLANTKYKIGDIENVAYFEPYYLKDFVTN